MQGMMMPPGTLIFSMVAVDSDLVLLGSNSGSILVYDGFEKRHKHALRNLQDSVLCLVHIKYVQSHLSSHAVTACQEGVGIDRKHESGIENFHKPSID